MKTEFRQECHSQSLRARLREETMPYHMALENRVMEGGYFKTADGYNAWLCIMQQVHFRFGQAADAGARRLGLDPISARLDDALQRDTGRQVLDRQQIVLDDAQAIGAAYVFEGSAMGARLLQRGLDALGTVPQNYIGLLIAESPTRWPKNKSALETHSSKTEEAVRGANKVFETLFNAFGELRC